VRRADVQTNPVIETMLDHRSVRKYTDVMPPDDVIETVVRAGQQAPFAAQLGSVLLKRGGDGVPFRAPLLFTILVDVHRLEIVIARRDWTMKTNDLSLLVFGIQDACYMAENMVIAGRSLGLGSCFIGGAPYRAQAIADEYGLPERVFPLVQLTMGYPDEDLPPRPRYPLPFALYEGRYPEFTDDEIARAMAVMDEGYLAQDYYRVGNYMIDLEGVREETFTFDTYSWTEHMGRKWGQWFPSPDKLLREFEKRGFRLTEGTDG
jgi:nitroreductase